jgi:hypothetical protein
MYLPNMKVEGEGRLLEKEGDRGLREGSRRVSVIIVHVTYFPGPTNA